MKHLKNFESTSKPAFTLVELIVVIVILAILATIAFLSFSSQSGSARDSVRLSDTTNIRKWLELRQAIGWSIPLPANPKAYTWWATATGVSWVMISEWTVNNSILSTLSAWIKDPSWTEYRYSTISQWWQPLYYQLALELENPTSMRENISNPFIAFNEDIASADTAVSKIVQLKWNYMFDPSLPSLFILSGSTSSLSGWIYNPDVCFVLDWSATNSFSRKDNCVAKKDMSLKDYDNSLVWYWDMETTTSWKLKDLSGNGKSWTWYNWIIIWNSSWVIWNSTSFNWSSHFRVDNFYSSWELLDEITLSAVVFVNKFNSWVINGNVDIATPFISNWHSWNINNQKWYLLRAFWEDSQNSVTLTSSFCFWTWIYSGASGWYKDYPTINSEYKDKWIMLSTTYSKDWTSKFYINWIMKWKTKIAEPYKISTEQYLYFWRSQINTWYLDWKIDDIKIYNRSLSDIEVRQQAKSAWF
ncbi:MAG: hypothetical protein ACD_3C00141G0004 [uncultured bacterium (gcode 4)]|uniref:Prepilin-type N-terminal cleavage/methylation domain-containing protein n=1 Tax=uncultured bacterium (gcode 4) TaxID=1234023 RepID=K2G108_9BACT|nr:MAG: hypothetical protein ACD_3C00141G0004 [uncultured bacterium (gcode 4)]